MENPEKHQEPTLDQMMNNLGYEDNAIDAEFVPEEQAVEAVPAQNNEKVRIPLIVGIASLVVGLPLSIVLISNGGNKHQIASKDKTEAVAANSPDPVRAKEQLELEKAKSNLFLESQKDKQKQTTASPSPTPSATTTPIPKATPTPELTSVKAKSKPDKEPDSSTQQEIAQLRAEIASLRKSQATQSKAPVRAAQIAQATPVRASQIAQATPKPTPSKPSPSSIAHTPKIAAEPKKTTATTVAQASKKDNWEEVAAASSYGGKEEPKPMASGGSGEPIAQQSIGAFRLPVGVSVTGRTGSPLAMALNKGGKASDKSDRTITVISEQPIQINATTSIPAGSNFEFSYQVGEDGLVQATSGKVFIGGSEVKMPAGAFALATEKGDPLMAQISQSSANKMADSDITGAAWSGLSEVGKALARAGDTNTTSNSGLGSTVTTVNNPNPNILGAGASGVFGTLAQRNNNRAEALNKRLESAGMVATLPANTKVQMYVVHAAAFDLPDGSVNAIAPPPAPPTAAETDPDVLQQVSAKRKQMARTTLVPINEQKPTQELPESLRGLD